MHDSAKSCSDGCISRDRRRFWGAHAARVLVSAARRNELDPSYHKPLYDASLVTAVVLDAARERAVGLRGSAPSTMLCSSSARYRCRLLANAFGVVTARIDRFIAEDGKGPYPDME